MSLSPNADNYQLGRGKILFNRKNTDGSYQGMRDLGNASAFSIAVETDKLEHFSMRTGLRTKDKTVVTGMNPTASFTLEEINAENLAMTFMASQSQVVQAADDSVANSMSGSTVTEGLYYDSGSRFIGCWKITHGTVTGGPFVVGETVTGTTSAATGVVTRVDAAGLVLDTVVGTFVTAETLTGGTSTATATSSSALTWSSTDVAIHYDTGTAAVAGTDFTVDHRSGKIFIMDGSAMTGLAVDASQTISIAAETYDKLNAFAESAVEGELHFLSDAAVGKNQELRIWDVSLTPSGDASFISEEWNSLEFGCEIASDADAHPLFPYMEMVVSD